MLCLDREKDKQKTCKLIKEKFNKNQNGVIILTIYNVYNY